MTNLLRHRGVLLATATLVSAALLPPRTPSAETSVLESKSVERFAELALACIHQEYPNKISHTMSGDQDAKPPRELTPAFYGCFDWHSAVHGHWLLARLVRLYPDAGFASRAREALAKSLTPENIAAEVRYMQAAGRVDFERPYGLAWLLQLGTELREWDDPRARQWAATIEPLERAAAQRLRDWVPKLTNPIRIGEHSQTAFAFGLVLDWARAARDRETEDLLVRRSRDFHLGDRDCPLEYEPSGHDFLSPCLAEADLMRRVLPAAEYAEWLGTFLPGIPVEAKVDWLKPAVVTDPSDPKLAHLDGLNLSRAWMLEGMASALPEADPRRGVLLATAKAHREAGLRSVTGEHYEGGHWLASFATYLVTSRGLSP